MNITEANAFNRICDFLGVNPRPNSRPSVTEATNALVFLAERSSKALGAGILPGQITEEAVGRLTRTRR